eukprot:TRINITY_DN44271_c0_g1_i2.p2 TRINITY_DN44271_c0_g1~~TRINITY_DN44271_c0_g1_i2.p2  ORF type:complete len:202 (+),score=43.37 TRINITY_DN44271_c0_g1_i2:264-869(+)
MSALKPPLMEPQALDKCLFENRHVSEWVVPLNNFEHYFHSVQVVRAIGSFSLRELLLQWLREQPEVEGPAVFEVHQEPLGQHPAQRGQGLDAHLGEAAGPPPLISRLRYKRKPFEDTVNTLPFAWIADPLNVVQTAVHLVQPRGHGQAVVRVHPEALRVNHYVDFGANTSRCSSLPGGPCEVEDVSITWAEHYILRMRRPA